jgi:hypothetical protein
MRGTIVCKSVTLCETHTFGTQNRYYSLTAPAAWYCVMPLKLHGNLYDSRLFSSFDVGGVVAAKPSSSSLALTLRWER